MALLFGHPLLCNVERGEEHWIHRLAYRLAYRFYNLYARCFLLPFARWSRWTWLIRHARRARLGGLWLDVVRLGHLFLLTRDYLAKINVQDQEVPFRSNGRPAASCNERRTLLSAWVPAST